MEVVPAMSHAQSPEYVAALSLGLGGGVTLQRYRAARGGLHHMRLVHHESGLSVERSYDDTEPVLTVQSHLIGRLQAKLSEKGMCWVPTCDRREAPAPPVGRCGSG
jgi:hypothetical protein